MNWMWVSLFVGKNAKKENLKTGFKKTKHAKFSEKWTFLTLHWLQFALLIKTLLKNILLIKKSVTQAKTLFWKSDWFHLNRETITFREDKIYHMHLTESCDCRHNFPLYYRKKLIKFSVLSRDFPNYIWDVLVDFNFCWLVRWLSVIYYISRVWMTCYGLKIFPWIWFRWCRKILSTGSCVNMSSQ